MSLISWPTWPRHPGRVPGPWPHGAEPSDDDDSQSEAPNTNTPRIKVYILSRAVTGPAWAGQAPPSSSGSFPGTSRVTGSVEVPRPRPLAGPGRGPSPWDSQLSRVESGVLDCPWDSLLLRGTQDLPHGSLLQSRSEAPGTGPGLGNFKAGSESPDRCRSTGRPARPTIACSAASARAAAAVRRQAQRSRPGLIE